ncbi:MAG: valine--tRNA ligase [Anaerolineales bacterium]|nr:valine--tRNA ligase [Anaerolineales bacterium]
MSEYSLPKRYDFKSVEGRLYEWWESQGYFQPEIIPGVKPYVISMPPPNVTGELHLGHAMFVSLEDMMIRHARMQGRPTLWVPGTDHAGIATQLQVEKYLLRTEEVTREEIGREAFVKKTWEWKEKYGGIILEQLRRLGASCDWTRTRFTLDDGLSSAVREAFVQLYEKGLIYRGSYLINWSPGLKTAVSDLEVEYKVEQGTLYYFNYPLQGSQEVIPVATTRPETILGDTAVAVHPEDERFKHLIGKTALVPILDRPIPVISDDYVDLEFGTGALKITPGHDPADYQIGQRHDLELINVLNSDATMNEAAGPYEGLDRFECRKRLWSDMEAAGLTIKTEPYTMQVPRSQRGGEIIEPMISPQWFVRMESLAQPAIEAVRDGSIEIVPARFEKVYYNWLENIRDWCISRQLWWGHRIPAWYCGDCGEITVQREDPDACAHCGSSDLEQDPDVLDTWFSSGLWPFSTLGWPDQTEDLEYFYPTRMMETGYDILFFWVARMIMMGLEFTGEIPFEVIYLHGLVRVSKGEKMSKTSGNVVDPLKFMDDYGTDALRFTLLTGSTPGQDTQLNMDRLEANRNFANKLWNAGRLILNHIEQAPGKPDSSPDLTLADRWILARLNELIRDVDRLFDAHQYSEAGRQIYDFFWFEFADWYLEIAKLQMTDVGPSAWRTASNLVLVFDAVLRMLHPFMPFVTEELWGHLKAACSRREIGLEPAGGWEEALIIASWPKTIEMDADDGDAVQTFLPIKEIITAIRNIRTERSVAPQRKIAAYFEAGQSAETLEAARDYLSSLAGIEPTQLIIEERLDERPADSIPVVVAGIEIFLPLRDLLDVDAETARLEAQLGEVQGQIERLEELLSGPFAERAPEDVVAQERGKLQTYKETSEMLKGQLEALGA